MIVLMPKDMGRYIKICVLDWKVQTQMARMNTMYGIIKNIVMELI